MILKEIKKYKILGIFIIGFFSGPWVIKAAESAEPPIDLNVIPFVLFGTAFGMLWIIGLQMFRKMPEAALSTINYFKPFCAYLLGAGLCNLSFSIVTSPGIKPTELFFAAIGSGMGLGLSLCGGILQLRYRKSH